MTAATAQARASEVATIDVAIARAGEGSPVRAALLAVVRDGSPRVAAGVVDAVVAQAWASEGEVWSALAAMVVRAELALEDVGGRVMVRRAKP